MVVRFRRSALAIAVLATLLTGVTSSCVAAPGDRDRDRSERADRDRSERDRGDRYRVPDRAYRYPPVGRELRSLPRDNVVVRVGRDNYRYHRGVYYRPRPDGVYLVVRPPIGARVGYLPSGYVSFVIGPRRYFYSDFTYYLWDVPRREYIVVREPENAPSGVVASAIVDATSTTGDIFVYPKHGQSSEQRERDRYECYLWGVQQTGFDPGAAEPKFEQASNYRRALSACLEGRGYTVK